MLSLITLLTLLSPSSLAATGYDSHGFTLVPSDGDLDDPLELWRPEVQVGRSFGLSGLFEYAKAPLVQYQYTEDGLVGTPLVDNLFGLNLGGSYALNRRIAFTLAMPVWVNADDITGDSHQALGDLRLAVPVGLLIPDEGEALNEGTNAKGFMLSAIPFIDLPSGSSDLYLGADGFGAGATVAAGYGLPRLQLFADLGLALTPRVEDMANLHGGPFVKAGLGASYRVIDNLAVRGEGVMNAAMSPNEVPFAEAPAEVLVSGRYRLNNGLNFTAGASAAVTPGAGAAQYRLFAGAGWTFGKDEAEAVAPLPCELTVMVQDPQGLGIDGSTVTVDNKVITTSGGGNAVFEDCRLGDSGEITANAPLYKPGSAPGFELQPGANQRVIVLHPQDSQLKVIVLDDKGQPKDARIRFLEGPTDHALVQVGPDGEETMELKPGAWKILVSAPTHVPREAAVTLDPGEFETVTIRFTSDKVINACTEAVVLRNVNFDFDVDKPRADALPTLQNVAASLKDCPEVVLEVGGHTDSKGSDAYNLDLSQRRMNSVKEILVGYGVAEGRLHAVGYGESKPIASNSTDKGRAQNRRVEFVPLRGEAVVLPPADVPVPEPTEEKPKANQPKRPGRGK